MTAVHLPLRTRAGLQIQRVAGVVTGIVWIPLAGFILRYVMQYRVHNMRETRARFRALVRNSESPLLICANHLTLVDSAVVAWALGGSWWYLFHWRQMPWNLPEYHNFAFNPLNRLGLWLAKCIPIVRGGARQQVSGVIKRVEYLLYRGDTALIFAEGGRSRTGRVRTETAAHGMGRIIGAVPECQALCVYLRGRKQETWSSVPARGDVFDVTFELMEPKSDHKGMRRSRDFAQQIVNKLAEMEQEYFDSRK